MEAPAQALALSSHTLPGWPAPVSRPDALPAAPGRAGVPTDTGTCSLAGPQEARDDAKVTCLTRAGHSAPPTAPPQVSLEVHPSQQPWAHLLLGVPSTQPARGRAHPLLCGRFSQPQPRPVSRDAGGVQRRPQLFRGAGVPVHPPGLSAQVRPVLRSPPRRRGRLPSAPRCSWGLQGTRRAREPTHAGALRAHGRASKWWGWGLRGALGGGDARVGSARLSWHLP